MQFWAKKFVYLYTGYYNNFGEKMLTKNVDTITDILLSKEIAKYKNAVAFQRFLSHQTENAKTNFNEIINETSNKQSVGCLKNTNTISANKATFKTNIEDSNDITTKEYATVPYPYLQSETTIKPDGTKIHTIYYPSNDEIPAKRIVYSAQSTVKKLHFTIQQET